MLMRITYGQVRRGMWSKYQKEFRRFSDPKIDGLLGVWLGRDISDADSIFTLTLWRDVAAIRAWEVSPLRRKRSRTLRQYLEGEYSFSIADITYGFSASLPAVSPGRRGSASSSKRKKRPKRR